MWEYLEHLTYWHWFILAVLLLVAEALGTAGFLLGSVFAAAITGLLVWLSPFWTDGGWDWTTQVLIGAILAVVCSVIYWRFFRADLQPSDRPQLNHRAAQMIGTRMMLKQDVEYQARIQIGDTFWKVEAEEVLLKGQAIRVYDADLTTLKIKKDDQ